MAIKLSSIVKLQKCIYHTCFVSSLVDDTELCIDSISYEYITTFNFCSKILLGYNCTHWCTAKKVVTIWTLKEPSYM